MKKLTAITLCLFILVSLLCSTAFASTGKAYYIDSISGNDANSGTTQSEAWKTVENLRKTQLRAGDSVLFRCDGIYACSLLTLTCKGTEAEPIVISSYGEGKKPLLTNSESCDTIDLLDCSYVEVSNLEITAHQGGGIWIYTEKEESNGIVLDGLTIHDIQNYEMTSRDSLVNPTAARACVMIKNLGFPSYSQYRVNNLTIKNCEMYDCGNGISLWGAFAEDSLNPWAEGTQKIIMNYNENVLVDSCYFHDMDAEGMIIGITDNCTVTNCRFINCCQGTGTDKYGNVVYYTAPVWYWGGLNSVVENCEIAGSKNVGDGMAVDFDSWTNYCTYQYIYSHDNVRFICSCPYGEGQWGNTVRYCLSVNDNGGRNSISNGEKDFSFYNNTVVNSSNWVMNGARNVLFANNIITGNLSTEFYWTSLEDDDEGNITKNECTGTFTNNCIWGACIPSCFENTLVCNPGFIGTDKTDVNSFMLSRDSRLLGEGITLDDMGERDFFGNSLTSVHNIGCYDGEGEDAKIPNRPVNNIVKYVMTVLGTVYQYISDIINKTTL